MWLKTPTKLVEEKAVESCPWFYSSMVANPCRMRLAEQRCYVPFDTLRCVFAVGHWWSEITEVTLIWCGTTVFVAHCVALRYSLIFIVALAFSFKKKYTLQKCKPVAGRTSLSQFQEKSLLFMRWSILKTGYMVGLLYIPTATCQRFLMHGTAGLVTSDSCYGISAAVITSNPFKALTPSWKKWSKIYNDCATEAEQNSFECSSVLCAFKGNNTIKGNVLTQVR